MNNASITLNQIIISCVALFSFSNGEGATDRICTIDVMTYPAQSEAVKKFAPATISVEKILFEGRLTLLDFKQNMKTAQIDIQWLEQIVVILQALQSFQSVQFRLSVNDRGKNELFVSAKPIPILGTVTITGIDSPWIYFPAYGLQKGHRFDEAAHNHGLQKITQMCQMQGYPRAKISAEKKTDVIKNEVDVVIAIEKGEYEPPLVNAQSASQKKSYTFTGNVFYSDQQLSDRLQLYAYDGVVLPPSMTEYLLIQEYKTVGFLDVTVTCTSHEDRLTCTIQEGRRSLPQASTLAAKEKIEKEINAPTLIANHSTVPLSKLQEATTQITVRDTVTSLQKLNLFDLIGLERASGKARDFANPIVMRLHTDNDYHLLFKSRAGLEQGSQAIELQYGLHGEFGIKNCTYHADIFSLGLDYETDYWRYGAAYEQPRFCGYGGFFKLTMASEQSVQPLLSTIEQPLSVGLRAITMDWEYQSAVNYTFRTGGGWQQAEHTTAFRAQKLNYKAADFVPDYIDKKIPYLFLGFGCEADVRDDEIMPRKGSAWRFDLGTTIPYSQQNPWVKITGNYITLVPMYDFVWAFQIRAGQILSQELARTAPNDRFYLGGPHSVRCYQTDASPPHLFFTDSAGMPRFAAQGGLSMAHASVELRIPLHYGVWAVLFQDAGVLAQEPFLNNGTPVTASGFGIRYYCPVGMIRFDIAAKLPVDSGAFSYAWFLSLSDSF